MIPLKCALSLDSYSIVKMISGLRYMVSLASGGLLKAADARARIAARAARAFDRGDRGKQTAG